VRFIPILRVVLGLFVASIGIYKVITHNHDSELSKLLMVGLGLLISIISIEKRNKTKKKK
jgi:hypothetical protein